MKPPTKRKDPPTTTGGQTRKKQWRTPKKDQPVNTALTINSGDAGIWATCDMHKEGKATVELRDLFEEYAVKLFGEDCLIVQPNDNAGDDVDDEEKAGGADAAERHVVAGHGEASETTASGGPVVVKLDIEASIAQELQGLQAARSTVVAAAHGCRTQPLFQAVRIDVQCVLFFKTRAPVEPVAFVERICRDAVSGAGIRRCRFVKRLTPMARMGKASWESLGVVARLVLGGGGLGDGGVPRKFAIRPTIRNHNVMKRDEVIKQIAQIAQSVGPKHTVDLKNYDYLILVDIYRNVLGMSVVGSDFEELRRFNLAEIYHPTPRPPNGKVDAAGKKDVAESATLSMIQASPGDGNAATETSITPTTKKNDIGRSASMSLKDEAGGNPVTEFSVKHGAENEVLTLHSPKPDRIKLDAASDTPSQ